VLWLQRELRRNRANFSALVVSHDAAFLEAVTTDIIVFADKKLTYHTCGYAAFATSHEQSQSRQASAAAAVDKKVDQQRAFIARQRVAACSKKGTDDNKLRQAKERERKLDRLSMSSASGHRFKTMCGQRPEMVQQLYKDPALRFHLPEPQPFRGPADLPALTLANVAFSYAPNEPPTTARPTATTRAAAATGTILGTTLVDVTVQVGLRSRIGILGENGAGKTTLMRLLNGSLEASSGEVHRHHALRIATITQHQLERLKAQLDNTAAAWMMAELRALGIDAKQQEVLNHLGSFGLSGELALRPIGMLSGGQKARLNLAAELWHRPHLVLLDEPTNHLDADALDALQLGLHSFAGGVVIISHSAPFMSSFCEELWTVQGGYVRVKHLDDAYDFEQEYSAYCKAIVADMSRLKRVGRVQAEEDWLVPKQMTAATEGAATADATLGATHPVESECEVGTVIAP